MADWGFWAVLAGVLLIAEVFTLTFVLGLFAVAAAAAMLVALLDAGPLVELLAFAGASGVLWLVVRPLERLHRQKPALATGTAALAGRTGTVLEEVTAEAGRVKLGGETWAARPLAPGLVLPVGSHVSVAKVDGATLVVLPEEI